MTHIIHSLATFRGVIGTSPSLAVESWTIGVRFGDPLAPHVGFLTQPLADGIHTDFSTFFTAAGFTNNVYFEQVRLYDIGTDNEATTAPVISAGDVANGGSSSYMPYQCSIVCTHIAPGLGAARRGRVFLPPHGAAITGNGMFSDGVADAIATGWAGFLTALNTRLAGEAVAVNSSGIGAGALKPIVSVRVGHVVDTHRSRRRSLPEHSTDSEVAVSP